MACGVNSPRRDKMRELFEVSCKADKTIKKGPIPKMGMERFCEDLFEKKVIGDVKAQPTPQVEGEPVPEFNCVLSTADAKQCFITVQVGSALARGTGPLPSLPMMDPCPLPTRDGLL